MTDETKRALFRTCGGGVITWTCSECEWHLGAIQDRTGEITGEEATHSFEHHDCGKYHKKHGGGVGQMNKHRTKKPPIDADAAAQNFEQEIRLRAYELYEARGKDNGHELEDWLRAEKEIQVRRSSAAAA